MASSKKKNGQPIRIGIPPYGFSWVRGKLIVDPKEIETVRLMLKLRSQGLPYRDIAAKLNAAGKRTRSRTLWEHTVIRRAILRFQNEKSKLEEVISWISENSSTQP
jgi:hypothetical protein